MRRSLRRKELEVVPRDDGGFGFVTTLTDRSFNGHYEAGGTEQTIHDFAVVGELDADLVITAIGLEARAHPFPQCPLVAAAIPQLIGESVASGWRRSVLARFAGEHGCTHVTTLLLGLSEVITLTYFQRMNLLAPYGLTTRGSGEWIAGSLAAGQPLEGACFGLAAGGPVIRRARRHLAEREGRVDEAGGPG